MNAQAEALQPGAVVAQEDRARADFYALISRLLYAGPDADLLAALAAAGPMAAEAASTALAPVWNALIAAAATTDAEAARLEYDSVFVGTGKAEITLYASGYLAESMRENVLVRLRAELAALGLARSAGAAEYEDHFAGLCEVMRHLILSAPDAAVQKQKSFFLAYLLPCYGVVCDAIAASPNTDFYKYVGRFTRAFLDVETESFELAS
jgi:TorA maturation chaperone TorD